MKKNAVLVTLGLFSALAFVLTGCVTEEAAASPSPAAAAPMGPAPAGVNTVAVMVDSATPNTTISVNGFPIGTTPVTLHVDVNPNGGVLYRVAIYTGTGSVPGNSLASSTSVVYSLGDQLPARIDFNRNFKTVSEKPAPFDTKPTKPNVQRE